MYCIIGYQTEYTPSLEGGPAREDEIEEIVATFDTKEMAENYIKKAKLKKFKSEVWSRGFAFKQASVLSLYASAEVHEYINPDFPHNPTI
jgi:hypothetical protein